MKAWEMLEGLKNQAAFKSNLPLEVRSYQLAMCVAHLSLQKEKSPGILRQCNWTMTCYMLDSQLDACSGELVHSMRFAQTGWLCINRKVKRFLSVGFTQHQHAGADLHSQRQQRISYFKFHILKTKEHFSVSSLSNMEYLSLWNSERIITLTSTLKLSSVRLYWSQMKSSHWTQQAIWSTLCLGINLSILLYFELKFSSML